MPLSDVLSQIPGYAGYQASRLRNQQQESADLEQFGKLQSILASIQKQQQGQAMMNAKPEQLKDPEFWSRLALATGKPEYQTHAEKLTKERGDAAQLEVQRGKKTVIQPDPQEVSQAADQGMGAPPAATSYSGGIFDSLTNSEYQSIADQAKALKTGMEKSNGIDPKYWQGQQSALAARETALLNRPEKNVQAPFSDIGKLRADLAAGRITQKEFDAASEKKLSGELPPLVGNALTSAGSQVASGMPLMQAVPGYGRTATNRRESVRLEAINQIKAQNPGMDDVAAGQELVNRQVDLAAGKRSIVQLNTMLGATRQAVDQLDFNVKKVSEEMAKLPSSDLSPVINAIARGASKWTGDPAYSALFYYMHAAGMESARILQGGQASVAQLHQGAADEAKKWADANFTTPAAWNQGVAPAMMAEGKERLLTYERAIAKQRPGRPADKPEEIREFATEADAIKSGVKGKVKIGGRNATIQ